MARSRCTCGSQVLWKADEAESDEWVLVALAGITDDSDVLAGGTQAAFCPACGRLWVSWGDGTTLAEYVPADPDVRPVRSARQP